MVACFARIIYRLASFATLSWARRIWCSLRSRILTYHTGYDSLSIYDNHLRPAKR